MIMYWLSLIAVGILSVPPVKADDTEIYVTTNSNTTPNVVFIMDTSGSMASVVRDSNNVSQGSRLEVVRQAAIEVINSTTNINIALMRFNNNQGGRLSTPMMSIDADNTRSVVSEVLKSYTADGYTPITESLYEGTAFLRGDNIKYGSTTTDNSNICVTSTETVVPVVIPGTGTQYPWWWEVVQDDWWIMPYTFKSSSMTWNSYNSLSNSIKKSLSKDYGITASNYGTGAVPWWFILDSSLHDDIRDANTGEYTPWTSLSNNTKKKLQNTYQINQTTYNSNIANDTTGPIPGTEDTIEYQTQTTCTEYLNLGSTHNGSGKYISPMIDECQTNHIVMFTDGDPTYDTDINTTVRNLVKTLPASTYPTSSNFSTSCTGDGGCAEELAWFDYHADNSSTLPNKQPIYVHTIGGFISGSAQTRLDAMATYGGGISGNGSDAATLKEALTKVFANISATSGTFAAPAVAVNAFNSMEHLDQLYFSVFRPAGGVRWQGNIKRYRIENGDILDVRDAPAVDDTTGFFGDNAVSFWTLSEDAPDGSTVASGGIARRLTAPASRTISTWLGGSTSLNATANKISSSNTNLTQTLFGTSLASADFTKLLQWSAGYDVLSGSSTSARREMEDPLHSRPVLLTYGYTVDTNGERIPDSVLFVGTNSGYLHAFNTNIDSPYEHFSFVPKELLPNLAAYYAGGSSKVYGMDGQISAWHQDTNGNSIVDNSEKAYLYAGMRRGGRNYYALDVSDRSNPKYLWQINGGSGQFAELGQSWSQMKLITIKWGGAAKDVLVFGGGYDPAEDNNDVRADATMGNAIFMVDAETGALLWKASPSADASLRLSGMTSAIPSNIAPVDMDSDGYVDLLFASDMGGRLWRIDFSGADSGAPASSYATGGVIADLGSDSSTSENVRFFTSPDVSWTNSGLFYNASSGTLYAAERFQIAIGSGYRAHPLDNAATDRLYLINDFNTLEHPASYTTLTRSSLANYSSFASASASQVRNGLYYTLPDTGEKALSDSITVSGYSYFTTYRPSDSTQQTGCEPDIGDARVYALKAGYYQADEDNNPVKIEPTLVAVDLEQPGIPPSPVLIIEQAVSDDSPESSGNACPNGQVITIGAETICTEDGSATLYRNYWREE